MGRYALLIGAVAVGGIGVASYFILRSRKSATPREANRWQVISGLTGILSLALACVVAILDFYIRWSSDPGQKPVAAAEEAAHSTTNGTPLAASANTIGDVMSNQDITVGQTVRGGAGSNKIGNVQGNRGIKISQENAK